MIMWLPHTTFWQSNFYDVWKQPTTLSIQLSLEEELMVDCLFQKTCAENKILNQGMVTNVACNNLISMFQDSFEHRW